MANPPLDDDQIEFIENEVLKGHILVPKDQYWVLRGRHLVAGGFLAVATIVGSYWAAAQGVQAKAAEKARDRIFQAAAEVEKELASFKNREWVCRSLRIENEQGKTVISLYVRTDKNGQERGTVDVNGSWGREAVRLDSDKMGGLINVFTTRTDIEQALAGFRIVEGPRGIVKADKQEPFGRAP